MPKMNINRSLIIDAPSEKIFVVLNNLNHWMKWSPWVIAEPDAHIDVAADGKYHEWEGNVIGSGNLKIVDEKENAYIKMDLTFLKPWKSQATTELILHPQGEKTLVVWKMQSSLPFFLFWMKKQMEIFVGMDYDRGLGLLKDLIETGKTNCSLDFQGEKEYPALQYIGVKTQCPFDEIGPNMEKDFTRLMAYIMPKHAEKINGPAVSIYHKTDPVKNKVVYTAGVPLSEIPKDLPEGIIVGNVPATKGYSIKHTGPYRHIGNAWSAGMMHQRGKVFKSKHTPPPMELMHNSPKNTPENDLVSEIVFPCK